MEQYAGFVRFAQARRRTPSLVMVGFTSLTLEIVRSLRIKSLAAFSRWKSHSYDPSHIPKAHHLLEVLQASTKDFPSARVVVFTDDIHFERARYILKQEGLLKPGHERVLAAVKARLSNIVRLKTG